MKRTKEEADITRHQLLQAALQVFSRDGYTASRLDDIAAEAEVTRGAIYHHFGGKAGLYNELIELVSKRFNSVIQVAIQEEGTALEMLRRLFLQTLRYVEQDKEFRSVQELIQRQPLPDPALEEGWRRRIEAGKQSLQMLEERVQAGISQGEVRPDVNARTVALSFAALQSGLLDMWLLDQSLFSLKEQAEPVIDLFLQSLAP